MNVTCFARSHSFSLPPRIKLHPKLNHANGVIWCFNSQLVNSRKRRATGEP